ncbi:MAG TPA: hypoxanthine phosphoribosyltransferase [Bacteroidales bacterium]|jgi:hypoxanthine phosphoribosyltransferase|nr:hypoxanthine phosphoribosyltransferase [Bacteroidales bacterium]
MSTITIEDKTFVKYISDEEIDKQVQRIARQINEDYKDDIPILIFTLNGAIVFAAELLKKLTIQCRISCIRVASYDGTKNSSVKNIIGLVEDLENQRVIVIDDIVDTGNTYEVVRNMLYEAKVKDVRIAAMTFKPEAYKKPFPLDYVGFEIPNKFIVGHGLDYNGLGRNLPDIYQLKTE